MIGFESRLLYHKSNGLEIERCLDIGAYRGTFSRLILKLWPEAKVWSFEADERQKIHNPSAHYELLGDRECEIDFYTTDQVSVDSTGSSVYIENSVHYKNPVVMKKKMTTIDKLAYSIDFEGNWKEKGLVKIDAQGSEIDILKGAQGFVQSYKPRLILLESSLARCNFGAPLIADVSHYMQINQYREIDILDLHYVNGRLMQADLLFERFL